MFSCYEIINISIFVRSIFSRSPTEEKNISTLKSWIIQFQLLVSFRFRRQTSGPTMMLSTALLRHQSRCLQQSLRLGYPMLSSGSVASSSNINNSPKLLSTNLTTPMLQAPNFNETAITRYRFFIDCHLMLTHKFCHYSTQKGTVIIYVLYIGDNR